MANETPAEFTVDTHVFRQLGELLVGRDATAVVELIKNAYDADATELLLYGENLGLPGAGTLRLVDNGRGMTESEFRRGFLRIASRTKSSGDRRSPVYRRRYTGEKGVGRLAAHKLAAVLRIMSVALVNEIGEPVLPQLAHMNPNLDIAELGALPGTIRARVSASMDWNAIESVETLAEIHGGLTLQSDRLHTPAPIGTTIELRGLRHPWAGSDLGELLRQVSNFEPPALLTDSLPRTVAKKPLLFATPQVRQTARRDPGMKITLAGDFGRPEEFWTDVARSSEWILEIDASEGANVKYMVAPTNRGNEENPFAKATQASAPHPAADRGPFFQARVLLRTGQTPSLAVRQWGSLNSGIRVYLEGFRVLPYGETNDDWLHLDQDVTRRAGRFALDPMLTGPGDQLTAMRGLKQRDYALRLQPARNFFGGIFITEEGGRHLRTLVNREGFIPDANFETLVSLVRVGTDLLHRARALANLELSRDQAAREEEEKAAKRNQNRHPKNSHNTEDSTSDESESSRNAGSAEDTTQSDSSSEANQDETEKSDANDEQNKTEGENSEQSAEYEPVGIDESPGRIQGSGARLMTAIQELHEVLQAEASPTDLSESVAESFEEVKSAAIRLLEDTSLLRVLASVGSQLAAFNHEVANLLPTARAAEAALAPRQGQRWSPEAVRARRSVADLVRSLERQSAYLVDVVSTDARRRRQRLSLKESTKLAAKTISGTAAAADINIINDVPDQLRVPPMFQAELLAVLTNLLTNAVKASGQGGTVHIRGKSLSSEETELVVENTGAAVDPTDGEKWFAPYASTSTSVDPTLGQGMGLGLPITRDLLAEYGGRIRFIEPSVGFSTAVEVVFVE